jgi:hypothetical protein
MRALLVLLPALVLAMALFAAYRVGLAAGERRARQTKPH